MAQSIFGLTYVLVATMAIEGHSRRNVRGKPEYLKKKHWPIVSTWRLPQIGHLDWNSNPEVEGL